jgi:hypothetical protein
MKSEKQYIRIYQIQAAAIYLGLACWSLPVVIAGRLNNFELLLWAVQMVLLPYNLFSSISEVGRFGIKKYKLGIAILTVLSLLVFGMLCLFGAMNFLMGIGNIIAAGVAFLIASLGISAWIDFQVTSKPVKNKDI